ncbi:uncharacterized protein O3C94_000481 [Discoglossus pictus]
MDDGSLLIVNPTTNYSGLYTVKIRVSQSLVIKTVKLRISKPANVKGKENSPSNKDLTTNNVPANNQPGIHQNTYFLVGGAVMAVVGFCFFITGLIIWSKIHHRRAPLDPFYENTEQNIPQACSPTSASGEYEQPDIRRLPSIPMFHIASYQDLSQAYQIKYVDLKKNLVK